MFQRKKFHIQKSTNDDVVVVTPGEVITTEEGYLIGHGTHVDDGKIVSHLAGVVVRVNKMISVRPLNSRYVGDVGDVVVGRIKEVGSKRWKVDIGARQDAVLMISSINLSGGIQRRRTYADQLQMRDFFAENDLISADIHSFYKDGAVALHARSLKYGKLENGQFVSVPPVLVKRLKQHFVSLPCGVDVILGNNGYIWVTATLTDEDLPKELRSAAGGGGGGMDNADTIEKKRAIHADKDITADMRLKIARVVNAITALERVFVPITPKSIMDVYNDSVQAKLQPKDMLDPGVLDLITATVQKRLMQG